MQSQIKPQVMILTGCASGIGRHLVGVFARQNHCLLATDINETALLASARDDGWDSSKVLLEVLDVRDYGAWQRVVDQVVKRWGRLDVLLGIAGYLKPGRVHELDPNEVALHMDINAKGVMFGTRAAAERMVLQGSGHIINFASLAGVAPVPGLALYSASKHAVRGFSISAAQELRQHGVFVTVVCPDAVQTPMLDLQVDYEEAALTFSGPRPLSVDDVARQVERVLRKRPMEVLLAPPRSGRAPLAKFAGAFPALASRVVNDFIERGKRAQAAWRGDESSVARPLRKPETP